MFWWMAVCELAIVLYGWCGWIQQSIMTALLWSADFPDQLDTYTTNRNDAKKSMINRD